MPVAAVGEDGNVSRATMIFWDVPPPFSTMLATDEIIVSPTPFVHEYATLYVPSARLPPDADCVSTGAEVGLASPAAPTSRLDAEPVDEFSMYNSLMRAKAMALPNWSVSADRSMSSAAEAASE